MNYIVDHIARKGTTHDICEDSSLSFIHNGLPYGVVSDGCSSEKESQFISSFLCMYYKKMINNLSSDHINRTSLELEARNILLDSPLFATFIFSKIEDDILTLSFIGDGTLFTKRKDNKEIEFTRIDQKDYPSYPEYSFNRFTDDIFSYRELNKYNKFTIYNEKLIEVNSHVQYPDFEFFTGCTGFILDINQYDIIGFCSDGIDTFLNQDNSIVNSEIIIQELCNVKVANENFLKRKINVLEKRGFKHTDDFSCVMFLNKDSE